MHVACLQLAPMINMELFGMDSSSLLNSYRLLNESAIVYLFPPETASRSMIINSTHSQRDLAVKSERKSESLSAWLGQWSP